MPDFTELLADDNDLEAEWPQIGDENSEAEDRAEEEPEAETEPEGDGPDEPDEPEDAAEEEPEDEPEKSEDEESEEEPDGEGEEEESEEEEETEPATFTLKVSGEEVEKSEEEVIALAQKGLDADQKYRDAAEKREEAEGLFREAKAYYDYTKTQPIEVARQLLLGDGAKPEEVDKLIFEYLQAELPHYYTLVHGKEEEKAALQRERELEELRREKQQRDAESAQSQRQKAQDSLNTEITEALTVAELEPTADIRLKVAEKIVNAGEAGENLTIEDAVLMVKREEETRALPDMSIEDLRKKYPKIVEAVESDLKKKLRESSTKPGAMRRSGGKPKPSTKPARRASKREPKPFDEQLDDPFVRRAH